MMRRPGRFLGGAALLAAPFAAGAQAPAGLTGDWTGALGPLALTAHLADPAGGPRTATLDIPAQNAQGLPLQFSAPADSVYLRLPQAQAYFAGRRAPGGQQLVGEWRQRGQALPLTLRRVAAGQAGGPRRPQTPKAPFPYQAQDVAFQNKAAGVTLAGTFTVPAGAGPFPAVVLLTGSGPEDRDETVFGHRPFWVLADYLTRRGVAVLRFDDRGVGGSQATSTSADYATDALAALAWLREVPSQDLARLVAGRRERATPPEPVAPLAQDRAARALTPATPVRPRRGLTWRFSEDGDRTVLTVGGTTLGVPSAVGGALRRALAGPTTPGTLGLDDADGLLLVRRLLREGMLLPDANPASAGPAR